MLPSRLTTKIRLNLHYRPEPLPRRWRRPRSRRTRQRSRSPSVWQISNRWSIEVFTHRLWPKGLLISYSNNNAVIFDLGQLRNAVRIQVLALAFWKLVFLKWRESRKPNYESLSSLDAAVGEGDVIGAGGLVSVPLLVLAEVVVRVIVLHRPTEKCDFRF